MANTNLNVLVKAQLDSSGVKAELKQIQKIAKKYPVELLINLKSDTLKKDIKRISQDIAELGNALGRLNLPYHSQIAAINEEIRAETKLLQVRKQLNKSILRSASIKMPAASSGSSDSSQTSSTEVPIEKYTGWIDAESSLNSVWNLFLLMKDAVCEVDTAMSALHDVTDETNGTYQQFLENANVSAQKLGKSVSGLVEQTANWAGMGFDLDDAAVLAETSSIYSNISGTSDADAISNLNTVIKAFNIEAADSIKIVDSLQKLGSNFSTNSASLGDGLGNSAALKDAGNDINETLAMLAGGASVTQDASAMGDALTVISLRIRGMKKELESLGEESEGVNSVLSVRDQIRNHTNGDVNIIDSAGNLESTFEILKEISDIWDELSNTDQTALLQTIGGSQYGDNAAALIQSFQSGQIDSALELSSMDSSGAAWEAQAQSLDSLSAKTQQFEAAFQSLAQTVVSSDFLKGLVDAGTGFLNILNQIVDYTGVLIPTIGIAGITTFIQNFA